MGIEKPKIEQEGFNFIFETIQNEFKSDGFKRVKVELWKYHRFHPTAIRRAIRTAEAVLKKGSINYSSQEYEAIASELPYEVGSAYVERVYGYYIIWLKQKNGREKKKVLEGDIKYSNWKTHFSDLANELHELLPALKTARQFHFNKDNDTLRNLNLSDEQLNGIDYIDEQPQRLLLEHLKTEIPELYEFKSWLDLKPSDLTIELLDQLTIIDMRKTFKGRCKACPEE
jgi:hypothetical protein